MLAIIAATVSGTCLLISAGEGAEAGHVAWSPNSLLRGLTDALNLFHQYPTARGTEVKWLVQALGAAVAVIAAAVIWFLRREQERTTPGPILCVHRISLTGAAQIALVCFGAWSLLSFRWAPWPDAAFGEGVRNLMVILWAVAIGRTLSPRAARRGAEILLAVLAATAAIGVWYHLERNPVQRLKFPIGNPIFLAACLLPGFTLACAAVISAVFSKPRRRQSQDAASAIPGYAKAYRLVLLIGGILALAALSIAFRMSDSRGPAIGLAIGGVVVLFLALRGVWRWVYGVVVLVGIGAMGFLQTWPVSWFLSRPDTVRFRLYAWRYAWDLFLAHPVIGRGQAAYVLLAEQLSRKDAIADPPAFPDGLLGHAHCEWLEIMSDLGAVGIALVVTAIGITLWGTIVALRRLDGALRWRSPTAWYLLALMAAFIAILVEAAFDVSLRMPGLPVILFTVWGLLWAMSRPEEPAPPPPPADTESGDEEPRRPVLPPYRHLGRVAVVLCSFAIAWLLGSAGMRDWMAALVEPRVEKEAENRQWDPALAAAEAAAGGRLATWAMNPAQPRQLTLAALGRTSVESRLSANYRAVHVANQAAAFCVQRLRSMLADAAWSGRDPATLQRIAHDDITEFNRYFGICVIVGHSMRQVMPGYPYVAGLAGEAWLLRREMELAIASLGGPAVPQNGMGYLAEARRCFALEHQRDPLDAGAALRLLQFSGDQPTRAKLDLLRLPLRRIAVNAEVESVMAYLVRQPDFEAVMRELTSKAELALDAGAGEWADTYAPETLRLAALAAKSKGDFKRAAGLAEQAGELGAYIADKFPAASGHAFAEQAHYLLLAYPDEGRRAADATLRALKHWPPNVDSEQRQSTIRDLSLYFLAAGDDAAAREAIQNLVGKSLPPEVLDRNIGYGLAELCETFLMLPAERRPREFENWLARSLQLAPQWPRVRVTAARFALEQKDEVRVREQLEMLAQLIEDPREFAGVLQQLAARYPNSSALQEFATRFASSQPEEDITTQPEDADTQPAIPSAPWPTSSEVGKR